MDQQIIIGVLFAGAIIVGAGMLSFSQGMILGRKMAERAHVNAIRETFERLTEAQKEAGVTPEQQLKINEIIARNIVTELKQTLKEL